MKISVLPKKTSVLTSLFLLISIYIKAQTVLEISGSVLEGRASLDDAFIKVFENGKLLNTEYSDAKGKFTLNLELDKIYLLEFGKKEYVSKKIEVNTEDVPEENRKFAKITYPKWKVDLFPTSLKVNTEVLNKPIGKIFYNPAAMQFENDVNYAKSIKPQLDKLFNELDKAIDQMYAQQDDLDEDYYLAVQDGDVFYKEKDYENALYQYQAALKIKPNESYPQKQVKKINELLGQTQMVEEQYQELIARADEAFKKDEFQEAKNAYQDALTLKGKENYPREQIAICDKKIAEAAAAAAEAERLAALKKEYDALVAQADQLYGVEKYEEARKVYTQAKLKIASESYPQEKIDEIDKLLTGLRQTDIAYTTSMQEADKLFKAKQYADAKTKYSEASQIKPSEERPKQAIKAIDDMLAKEIADNEAKAKAEAERLAKLKADFEAAIKRGDDLFAENNFSAAKIEYQKAAGIKTDETYPKEKITEIDKLLLAEKAANEQYTNKMKDAQAFFEVKKYAEAKSAYEAASTLKPNEQAPKEGIKKIDNILSALDAEEKAKQEAEATKLAQQNAAYQEQIAKADAAFEANNFEEAKKAYIAASGIKTEESYPKTQIQKIDELLAQKQQLEKNYREVLTLADKAFSAKDFAEAKNKYTNASQLKPDESYPKEQIQKIEEELNKLAAADAKKQAEEAERISKLEADYQEQIKMGDGAYTAQKLEEAKRAYNEALKLKSQEKYPQEQIQKIDDLIKQRENAEANYKSLLATADKAFSSEDWNTARDKYTEALGVKPGEKYPSEQLAKIETFLETKRAEEERKKAEEQAKLAAIEKQYNDAIAMADKAFNESDWANAKAKYNEAKTIKPNEKYPVDQLALIVAKEKDAADAAKLVAQKEAEEKARKEKYAKTIQEADALFSAENWNNAKEKYQEAIAIVDSEEYPKTQIEKIDTKLAELAIAEAERARLAEEERQKTAAYQQALEKGTQAMNAKKWDEATLAFSQAAELKPQENLPKTKLKEIDTLRAEEERIAEQRRLEEERKAKFEAQYNETIERADKLFEENDLVKAKVAYEQASNLLPNESYPKAQIIKINDLQDEERKLLAQQRATDTEFNYELARKYPQGRSEREYEDGNKTVLEIVFVTGDRGDEYRRETYSWGQVFYLKNRKQYNEVNWKRETTKK